MRLRPPPVRRPLPDDPRPPGPLLARALAPAALVAVLATHAAAQGNGYSLAVAATVTEAISVTTVSTMPMAFGTVYPGIDAVLTWTAASAGAFEGRFRKNASVDLVFAFSPLSNGTGGSLVIEGADGCWVAGNSPKPATCPAGQSFIPTAARTNVPITASNGRFEFWIGARVRPSVDQSPGSYTGTIQVTALTPST